MSETLWVAIAVSIPATITAIAALVVAIRTKYVVEQVIKTNGANGVKK
jgi:hypothetical protein